MNYKSIFLFFLVFLFPSIYISKNTVQYKCADDLKIDTCYLRTEDKSGDDTTYTIYVKGCSKKKKCVGEGGYVDQCVKVKEFREEDDSCEVNEECQSGVCSSGKCSYIADGQECENDESCKKNSYCKMESGEKGVCTALIGKDKECNEGRCGFGLICNTAVTPSVCTEMFSLEDGKESNEDFLCKSGTAYEGKCATTKTVNSTCTENEEPQYGVTCQITYNIGGSDESGFAECSHENGEYVCPLQSDSTQMKDYIEEYTKQRDKMKQKDIDKIHVGSMGETARYTLNGHKKVLKAYVNLEYYKEIGDDDCIRDYFITRDNANKNKLSTILLSLLLLLII